MRGSPKTRNFLNLRALLLIASVCYGGGFLIATATLHGAGAGREKLSSPEIRLRLLTHFEDTFACPPPVERIDSGPVPDAAQHDPEALNLILSQIGLKGSSNLSHDQQLLIYREYTKMRAMEVVPSSRSGEYVFKLEIRNKDGDFLIEGTVDRRGHIRIQDRQRTVINCPSCLAAGTQIDTPAGPVRVEDLRPWQQVWTLDRKGHRKSAPILRTASLPVSPEHRIIHLVLKDGRELWVSPEHPTADGRTVAQLQKATAYDGSVIEANDDQSYRFPETYDLLPAGDTGFYWANGVLLASTLR